MSMFVGWATSFFAQYYLGFVGHDKTVPDMALYL